MRLQLEYVHLVHRHGERTPLMFGPHDKTKWNLCHRVSKIDYTIPKRNVTAMDKIKGLLSYMHIGPAKPLQFKISQNSGRDFNCAPGQLTDTGRANLFSLGTWFRQKYVDTHGLIKPNFDKNEFHLRSTNFQRTLESLQSLMQGMYRNYSSSMDVKVVDMTQDTLTCNRYCPRLKSLKEVSHEKIKKMFEPQAKEIRKYFSDNHSSFFSSLSPYAIYDLVVSSRAHGFVHFKRVPQHIMDTLEKYSIELWFKHLNSKEALSLNTGGVMKEIAEHMIVKATDERSPLKASIFSAHDVTVYPILMAVGLDTKKWPKFGANVIFELFKNKDTQERYVQMRYNGKKTEMPRCNPVRIKDGLYCPLESFVQMCNETYIQNFSEACIKE
ncbi:lysophosphatidic acid phosphatase type 6 [Nematocida minor]|uniref:lysophosphatidic acid phosphatase type 6 n=1 Tax=Nematocida minor TaxID=1912983 RepID=UPI00221EC598|nr:lysophosphatidic acid phosphatase type 6 [Nematocida minor]XP_051332070.1 lysophosphatidic acid phosphatase type 6 [Nematocida minor]KAI5188800.1 lysophosphatidic acid phosphatase type 6 [Nematocida minor]KAI5188904.1 lysophosphatidic acid phosphatase type 6 [Nematocida minor]